MLYGYSEGRYREVQLSFKTYLYAYLHMYVSLSKFNHLECVDVHFLNSDLLEKTT